ncbi:hypothetical protein RUM44_002569 [Polyplax serrata]|uniref:DNA-directed RNA polymerase n=1 Tax=Polyplax serrata TaxID=468196 RepID=A0ABR1AGG8_POLSC
MNPLYWAGLKKVSRVETCRLDRYGKPLTPTQLLRDQIMSDLIKSDRVGEENNYLVEEALVYTAEDGKLIPRGLMEM